MNDESRRGALHNETISGSSLECVFSCLFSVIYASACIFSLFSKIVTAVVFEGHRRYDVCSLLESGMPRVDETFVDEAD